MGARHDSRELRAADGGLSLAEGRGMHHDALTAVILAAGVGSRMGIHTADRPKALLEVAPGYTVLGLQLDRLFETGRVARVVVVTGYRSELVEQFVARHPRRADIQVELNPFYEVSNNLHSLWLARRHLENGGVIVNGDDVFHPDLLGRALAAPGDVAVTINCKASYDDDDMKVVLEGRRVKRIGKDVPLDAADGEAIGVIRLSRFGAHWVTTALEELVRSDNRNIFYLRAIQRVIDAGYPVAVADITPIPWGELDEPKDLASIREHARELAPELFLEQAA
jgi:choline kinase